jgi:class 3 adenylate cyclase
VVVSQETAQHSDDDPQVWFDPLGAVELKGVAQPLQLYEAYCRS